MGKRKRCQQQNYESEGAPSVKRQHIQSDLPEGVHHYQHLSEVPWDIQKYWHQGYSIFSKYDDGVWMTDNAWFEVTHEPIANKIAEHVAATAPKDRSLIIDAFCGVGGNTIAFALSGRWKRVYAIEKDEATLACAKHNAEIYGVADKITWFQGDCFEILDVDEEKKENAVWQLKTVLGMHGVIFASPPWGGPGYKDDKIFNLETMQPYNLSQLYDRLAQVTSNVVLYLPRTSDLNQIAKKMEKGQKAQVIHYCQRGVSKALCAYFGDWQTIPDKV